MTTNKDQKRLSINFIGSSSEALLILCVNPKFNINKVYCLSEKYNKSQENICNTFNIDYILFDGLSNVTDGVSDQVTSIKFIDIKTGSSGLNKVQRRIRDCINEGNITFEVINPDKDND